MILKRLMALVLLICLFSNLGKGQTLLLAEPVADKQGMIAFKVTQILRIEGSWEKPIAVDQLLYPIRPEKALPLGRFGESVLIVYRKSGDLSQWEGLNIHNGCIPALNGRSSEDLLADIARMPAPVTLPPPGYHPAGTEEARTTLPAAGQSGESAHYAFCPICKVRHIRIQ